MTGRPALMAMSLELVNDYAPLLSALASLGGFFIWTAYAFLFYGELRRRRSSHLFIHAAGDGGADTECLVINLSSEPMHILCSLAAWEDITVQVQASPEQKLPIKAHAKQGPLESGESLSLGRFDSIAESLLRQADNPEKDDSSDRRIEVRIAAIHGPNDKPVGASRGFYYNSVSARVIPDIAHTEQKRSRIQSREVQRWMEQCRSYRD